MHRIEGPGSKAKCIPQYNSVLTVWTGYLNDENDVAWLGNRLYWLLLWYKNLAFSTQKKTVPMLVRMSSQSCIIQLSMIHVYRKRNLETETCMCMQYQQLFYISRHISRCYLPLPLIIPVAAANTTPTSVLGSKCSLNQCCFITITNTLQFSLLTSNYR